MSKATLPVVHYWRLAPSRAAPTCHAPDGARSPGFDALAGQMVGKEWPHDDGPVTGIGLCFIEPGWQVSVAHEFCGG